MTSTQVYGLMAPFFVMGLGWLAYWWNRRQVTRLRGDRAGAHHTVAE